MSSSPLSNVFLAYDIRGRVKTELTTELLENIGKSFADWLPTEGPVAIGHDMRPDSAELAAALVVGLTAQGRDVWDIGQVTTDMVYFAVGKNKLAGGAMITASHNPGDYNGIKLCREGARPIGIESGLAEIRDNIEAGNFKTSENSNTVIEHDVTEGWIEHVLSFVDAEKLNPFKIAVDAGNGMAGKIFPELEPYVPFEVEEMYFELDGTFPNHIANPLEHKNLVDVIAKVKETSADAGIAFDGDGDRAVLVDEKGNTISGTVMTAILSRYFLTSNPGATILYNAICGRIVPDTIKQYGGKGIRTKVGHSFIKAEMGKHSAVFGGEHSGHYYFRDNYNADSGLIAAIVALAVLSESGKKLSELADDYRTYSALNETNFEVTNKDTVMKKVESAFPDAQSDWLDGLTLTFNDGWINVRPSNTEPLLRLNAEAATQESLDKMVEKVTSLIS